MTFNQRKREKYYRGGFGGNWNFSKQGDLNYSTFSDVLEDYKMKVIAVTKINNLHF